MALTGRRRGDLGRADVASRTVSSHACTSVRRVPADCGRVRGAPTGDMPPGDLGERLAEPGRTGVFAGEGGIRETGDQGRPRPQCLHLGFTPTTSPRPLPLSPRGRDSVTVCGADLCSAHFYDEIPHISPMRSRGMFGRGMLAAVALATMLPYGLGFASVPRCGPALGLPVVARNRVAGAGACSRGLRMAATEADTWTRPAARGKRDIVFGTRIVSSCSVAPKHDAGCSLPVYMQLPTDQYVLIPLPNNAKLEKKDEQHFTLLVPELQIFNVWLRPHVLSRVDVTPAGVIIEAVECRLDGSPEVERLKLNDVFEISVKVQLQGQEDPRGLRNMMTCNSEITVWVDPPQIFRALFPKPLMLETGNAVVRSTLRLLQTTFLQGLASDYNRWATDAEYRQARQQRT